MPGVVGLPVCIIPFMYVPGAQKVVVHDPYEK